MQNGRESRGFRSRLLQCLAPTDDMSPERDAWAGDIAPKDIQLFVPHIELVRVRALEAGPSQTKYLQVVSGGGPNDLWCNMRQIRDVTIRRKLTSNGGWARYAQHDGKLPAGAPEDMGATSFRRCPDRRGRSRARGL